MTQGSSRRAASLYRLLSPYGLAAFSTVIFFIAVVFPPEIYSGLVGEKDLMFMDLSLVTFFCLCLAGFFVGLFLIDCFAPATGDTILRPGGETMKPASILVPLACGAALNAVSIVQVVANEPSLLAWIASGQGAMVKEARGSEGTLILTGTLSMAVFWWGIWRAPHAQWCGFWKLLKSLTFGLSASGIVFSAVLKLGRGEIMPFITGTAVLLALRKMSLGQMTKRKFITSGVMTVLLVIVLFAAASALRGAEDMQDEVAQVVKYSLASYNRQAALLSGRLVYPTAGSGVYLSSFVATNRSFNALFPIQETMRWPTFYDLWDGEFEAVGRAGLNRELIWLGMFGYIFSDLGWAAPIFMLFCGIFVGVAWRSVRRGGTLGIVVYPWCAFSILLWFGNNQLFDTKCAILTIGVMALATYEHILARNARNYKCHASLRSAP